MMQCITPLPAVSEDNLIFLRSVYKSTSRTLRFDRAKYGVTNHFIDDSTAFSEIVERIIKPLGMDPSELGNMWNEVDPTYKCPGINFNVLCENDYVRLHIDTNPTKINILLSGYTDNHIYFVNENETWDWTTPALIDVSKLHYVTDDAPIKTPRVMMQIFLTKPYAYYRDTINLNPKW